MTLTTDRKVHLLSTVGLFDGIGADDLVMVAERTIEVDFPAGRVIVRQGEVGTGFFLIASGTARVTRDGATIAELGPGDFFGELSLLDGGPRIATVTAETATNCLALASWEFEEVLVSQPGLAIAILKGVAVRLRTVSEEHRH
jgi:CRP/FNR family cyclic AMP-dependent transcriptional regulator